MVGTNEDGFQHGPVTPWVKWRSHKVLHSPRHLGQNDILFVVLVSWCLVGYKSEARVAGGPSLGLSVLDLKDPEVTTLAFIPLIEGVQNRLRHTGSLLVLDSEGICGAQLATVPFFCCLLPRNIVKGMRELREILRTVETKATQNFKVVMWLLAAADLCRGQFGWEATQALAGGP